MNDDLRASAFAALESLAKAIATEPGSLSLVSDCSNTRRDFVIRAAQKDHGVLVGAKGSHFGALRLIAYRIGEQVEEHWRIEDMPARDGSSPFQKRVPVPEPKHHDPAGDLCLLVDLLRVMRFEHGNAPAAIQENPAVCRFEIQPATQHAQALLLDPDPEGRSENVLAALGTLFRAIGRRQGVRYEIGMI